jgi:hypothetical protein
VTVKADTGADIADLQATLENLDTGESPSDVRCAGGGPPCTWYCQSTQYAIPGGHYQLTLSAPGYANKTVEFTVATSSNCGCCGCGCSGGYSGTVDLTSDGGAAPGCCADRMNDATNCGQCGNKCAYDSQTCMAGTCENVCLPEGSSCDGSSLGCCTGLTCCAGAVDAPKHCYSVCPP